VIAAKQTTIADHRAAARLDIVRHPFGPCPAALDAAGTSTEESMSAATARLKRRLGELYHVPAGAVHLFAGIDTAIRGVVDTLDAPLVVFPPSATAAFVDETWPSRERIAVARGFGQESFVGPDLSSDLDSGAVALVDSPSDPLGSLLRPADAVRIARACRYLLVDERFAEFSGFSLLPLARDFDNIVVFRSFDTWAGLHEFPLSWVVISPRAVDLTGLSEPFLSLKSVALGLATLESLSSVEATLRLVRDERSRLYRLLRKLLYLEPVPSWGPFIAARATIGHRDAIVDGLRERGVLVHAPNLPGLGNFIRFGIGSRSEMDRLRKALLDLAPILLA
jgi:histidinol-phosphate/aromatic aminotransferase/cobyric acid decarboxylase-like protein